MQRCSLGALKVHTKYTAQLIKILFKYVQPETQRQTHLKAHLGTDPNWVIVPCRQNQGPSRIRAAKDSRMPSKGLQSVNSSSRELLDPCMMSKAHVVGGVLGVTLSAESQLVMSYE